MQQTHFKNLILDFSLGEELYPLELLQLGNHGLQVGLDIFGHFTTASQGLRGSNTI